MKFIITTVYNDIDEKFMKEYWHRIREANPNDPIAFDAERILKLTDRFSVEHHEPDGPGKVLTTMEIVRETDH